MARQAVAVDFLGILGQSSVEKQQNNNSSAKEPGMLLKNTIPSAIFAEKAAVVVGAAAMTTRTFAKPSIIDLKAEEREKSISRLRQIGEQTNLKGMQQLPSWNIKPEIVRQGAPSCEEDNIIFKTKESGNGLIRSPLWSSPLEDSTTTDPSTSPMGWLHKALQQNGKKMALSINNFQGPRMVQNAAAQTLSSGGDEPQKDAQPLEPAGAESPLSVLIPDTESQPPAADLVQGTGFGSPLPVHFGDANTATGLENEAAMDHQQFHQTQNPMMHCENIQSSTLPRSAQVGGAGVHEPNAQLTLFYSGVVHVYDDITLDKVQAIMLLASERTTSSSCKDPSGNGVAARPFSAPISQSTPSVSPAPQATSTATAAPPSVPNLPTNHANVLPRSIARNVHAVTELPQARKASLARFLEKRKDRVRAKAPYPIKKEGCSTPPRDKSPSPPCSRQQTWSPASAILRWRTSYLQNVPSPHYCTSSGSEPNSPTRTPPTPPQLSIAGDNIIARSFADRDCGAEPDSVVHQIGKFLRNLTSQDHQAEEPMEEDAR